MIASIPAAELADMDHDDLFELASAGNPHAQEMMAHRVLKNSPTMPGALEVAELWASMASGRGHALSWMTVAQICAARARRAAGDGNPASMIEHWAQAIMMFDRLAQEDEPYSMSVTEELVGALKYEACAPFRETVLARAREMQAA